jgi:alpha-N-arabinofuranosidase
LQPAAPVQLPLLSFDSTRDSKTGSIYIKVVNRADTAQAVHIAVSGASSVASTGRIISITGNGPEDTNSITEPKKIVPVTADASGLSTDFTHTFAPFSVNVLELKAASAK